MTPRRLRWRHINADPDFAGCLILAVFGLAMCLFGSHFLNTELRYIFDGTTADAQVVNKWIAARGGPVFAAVLAHGGGRRGPRYNIRYEFHDAAGQVHGGQGDIDATEWQQLAVGATVPIEYVQSDPTKNRLAGHGSLALFLGLTLGGAAALFGALTLIRSRLRTINEQVRLTLTGRPVLGLIEAVERQAPRKGAAYLIVRYKYLADGEVGQQVYSGGFRCGDRKPTSWSAGDPLLILVDESEPARHAPDRFHVRPQDLATLRQAPAESTAGDH
jgi:hypothetical protein